MVPTGVYDKPDSCGDLNVTGTSLPQPTHRLGAISLSEVWFRGRSSKFQVGRPEGNGLAH